MTSRTQSYDQIYRRLTACTMTWLLLTFAFAVQAFEHDAITLQIKGDDGSSIIIRLLDNQKYQSYLNDDLDLSERELPEHFSKEKFTEIWKLAEAAVKNTTEGTFQVAPDKEAFTLILRMNGTLRTYHFLPKSDLPKSPADLERVRRAISGMTKW